MYLAGRSSRPPYLMFDRHFQRFLVVCDGDTAKFLSCSAVYFLRGSFTWGGDIKVPVDLPVVPL